MEQLGFTDSISVYSLLLVRFLGFYRPLEELLLQIDSADLGLNIRQRCKSQWIVDDLTHLETAGAVITPVRLCPDLPPIHNGSDALGVLYVLEGATLGGQVISRRLNNSLGISSEIGGRFFYGYGDQTSAKWQEFTSVLEHYNEESPTATAVEESAHRTFRAFGSWIQDLCAAREVAMAQDK